ncbi:MAG: BON domain-containing protein [Anaerolineales bacterium]|jgi:osmotically-inducible protein OsmY
MLAAQTTQSSIAEFSRCDDRSWLPVEEQNVDHKTDKADASIAEKVDHALWNIDVLRSTDYREINVYVKDGVVFLSGHVISAGNQQRAEVAARTTPGVLGVRSYLVPDDKIKREVAGALGKIEHVYGVKFFTGVQNGVVGLHGEVGSATVRSLAEKCSANIPGVRGVINSVRAPGVDLEAEDQRFLQPSIGVQIYFRDGLSGKVQRVIINPNNRRVVAMVVRGRYSNSQEDPRFLPYGEERLPERLVAIPMSTIRFLTKSSGFLKIDSAEAARYSDFDPSCFIVPREDWRPPYPYCPDEVLFPVESVEDMNQTTESEPAIMPAMFAWTQPAIQSGVPE